MRNNKYMKKIAQNLKETGKNKLCALVLIAVGMVPILIEGDATFMVFGGIIAIWLFFAKENWII